MKLRPIALALLGAALATGCAHPDRSRDLGNPNVTAVTLAQQVCSNCHGLTGNSVSPNFPNLAGQMPAYLVEQLRGFRSHGRQDPAGFEYMWGLSRSLTDAQIDGLAAYYAGQPATPLPPEGGASRVAAGKAIFHDGLPAQNVPACIACHGENGQGNAGFPRLAGQHADYTAKQLLVFQRTDERPEGAVMKVVAHELTAENIRNVAAYVQALGSP
ncbi:c-type cytochrome [Caenimonas terrae]|uniref:C-type cytochrome n=1 Tax=Caenimonas terrae TaxID=696074 RepID=A0ABW0NEQ2_9BURK